MHWIRRAMFNQDKIWAKNIIHEIQKVGGIAIFESRVDTNAINGLKSLGRRHVRYLLEKLRELQLKLEMQKVTGLTPIFHNEELAPNKRGGLKPDTYPHIFKIGLRRVRDFYDADGRLLKAEEATTRGLPAGAELEWLGVTTLIKKLNTEATKNMTWSLIERGQARQTVPRLKLGGTSTQWTDATQKLILRTISRNRKVDLTPHQERITGKYGVTQEEWERLYGYIKKHSIATKKRDFLYKWICTGAYTNTRYSRFGVKTTAACQYCGHEKQTFGHLFEYCKEVNEFRARVAAKWENKPSMKQWLLGMWTDEPGNRATTFIIFELNHYIQIMNWKNGELSLAEFKGKLRSIEFIERTIAMNTAKNH